MWARESSDEPRLTIAALAGPVLALANQQLIYMANMWTCGHHMQHAAHVIPALCLIVTGFAAVVGYRAWRITGLNDDDEGHGITARARFLGITGVGLNVFAALVIIAQWIAILVFDPCMRA